MQGRMKILRQNRPGTGFIVLFGLLIISASAGNARPETLVLVYSHNSNGILENCACPEHSYGALEKRAFIIDSLRQIEKNILLLDTGDILDIWKNTHLHRYVMRAYKRMNYDYWTPGDQDFVEGVSFFLNEVNRQAGQLLVNNLAYQDKAIGASWRIEKFKEVSIGLTGTIRSDLMQYLDKAVSREISFLDQISHLQRAVRYLKKNSDYIILLSHSGIDRDRDIADQFPPINLIIGGHSQTLLEIPEKHQNTYIVQVGESGYRLGILKLHFEKQRLQKMEHKVLVLTKARRNDPQVKELISEYHQQKKQ